MARDAIHQLLATDIALDKRGARGFSAEEAEQLLHNCTLGLDDGPGPGLFGGRPYDLSVAPERERVNVVCQCFLPQVNARKSK
jgi:hypothetical protein